MKFYLIFHFTAADNFLSTPYSLKVLIWFSDFLKEFVKEIFLIGKDFSNERNIEVHCKFQKTDKLLIPGMFMIAEINVQTSSGLMIPSEAIVCFENKQYVFFKKGEQEFEMIKISSGNTQG